MKDNKDREVKELSLALDDSDQIEKEKKDDSDNSFYDRQSEKESTTWTQDWRAKTLGISLATIVLLGVGIPAGMAMTGYWNNKDMNFTEKSEDYGLAEDLIQIWTNEAIINHYASMVYEGYITQNQYEIDIKNAEKDAEDTIDSEKSEIKKEYGNTWEDKWDESLQSKGFHSSGNGGEEEYKDSLISAKILGKEISKYNTYNTYVAEVNKSEAELYEYSSNEKSSDADEFLVIDNTQQWSKTDKNEEEINIESSITIDSTSFTSEDLFSLYIVTFEPIVYNQSRIPFSLVDEDGGSSIDALSITVTTEDLEASLGFYNEMAKYEKPPDDNSKDGGDIFEPAAQIFGGVQSQHNLSLGSSSSDSDTSGTTTIDNIAIGMNEANNMPTEVKMKSSYLYELLYGAFFAAIEADDSLNGKGVTPDNLTPDNIKQMGGKKEVTDAFASSLFNTLSEEGGPLSYGQEAGIYREYYYNYSINDVYYTMYVSTEGLNLVGTQKTGFNLIEEQLSYDNKSKDSHVNYKAFESYETWLTNNFSKILLWDYIFIPGPEGWFEINEDESGDVKVELNKGTIKVDGYFDSTHDYQLGENDEDVENDKLLIGQALIATTTKETRKSVLSNYLATEDFVKSNEDVFGPDSFNSDGLLYFTWLTDSNVYSFYNDAIDMYHSNVLFLNNELINNKGDDE